MFRYFIHRVQSLLASVLCATILYKKKRIYELYTRTQEKMQAEPLFIIYNPYYIRTSRSLKRTNLFGLLALALLGVLGLLLRSAYCTSTRNMLRNRERTLQ